MAVPDFQSLLLPMLRFATDGKEHRVADAREALGSTFDLSDADRNELLPSGRQTKFANRVAWAKVYLEQLDCCARRDGRICRLLPAAQSFSSRRQIESISSFWNNILSLLSSGLRRKSRQPKRTAKWKRPRRTRQRKYSRPPI